jgi:hypothetical protein
MGRRRPTWNAVGDIGKDARSAAARKTRAVLPQSSYYRIRTSWNKLPDYIGGFNLPSESGESLSDLFYQRLELLFAALF